MPRKAEDKEEKRNVILNGALEVFTRYGYDKTTLDDIGKVVGLNKASLYYYYKNKEEIFLATVLRESQREIALLQEKVKDIEDVSEKIITYFIERLQYYRQVLGLMSLSTESLRSLQPVFDNLYREMQQKEVSYIAGCLATLVQGDSHKAAGMLFAMADALKHKAVLESGAVLSAGADFSEVEQHLRYLIGLHLKGLQAN
ncbi:TetR/AcrR family transcriptional regulator [Telluribacter humicola]|uniref:TetR/AcrR family transcriptional regulator n=1 Tax=Telluribacter humicola TaxID=1720261 RepID=UPI001A97524D|nr:TetR/AcrR family transcriptional regulator [Telluribacter humicola]